MKLKSLLVMTLVLTFSLAGFAQTKRGSKAQGFGPERAHRTETQTAEQLAKAVAEAFAAKELGKLDAEHPYLGMVAIRVEHSITGHIQTKSFKSLALAEKWFMKGGVDPNRSSGTLKQCRRGVCAFELEGMIHNTLFLTRVTYGMRRGRPYLKAIHIIDGD